MELYYELFFAKDDQWRKGVDSTAALFSPISFSAFFLVGSINGQLIELGSLL